LSHPIDPNIGILNSFPKHRNFFFFSGDLDGCFLGFLTSLHGSSASAHPKLIRAIGGANALSHTWRLYNSISHLKAKPTDRDKTGGLAPR